jgi:transglutaminase-like putative cysteine protease
MALSLFGSPRSSAPRLLPAQRGSNAPTASSGLTVRLASVSRTALAVAALLGAGAMVAAAAPHTEAASPVAPTLVRPEVSSTTSYRLRQTVRLREVPKDAKKVRLWAPIPSDTAWQRVLDVQVVDAPAGWTLVRQDAPRGQMIYCEVAQPKGPVSVTVECTVLRDAVRVPLGDQAGAGQSPVATGVEPGMFPDELSEDSPLMEANDRVTALASDACKGAVSLPERAVRLLELVANSADHYSKDPSKPKCGRGSAEDCMAQGGGCCTDLHSLFIALARSQGIPARLQFGYRLTAANEGKVDADPGYRCWVEYFLPGRGWVPTDIVVADSGDAAGRTSAWGTLDDRRVWLWEGRGFTLAPAQTGGPIQTMIVGYAEVDGKSVDPLPAADGTPSALERKITFSVLKPS